MSMTDRIPQVAPLNPQKEEKEIFTQPEQKQKPQTTDKETEKKLALKEHLAKCRQKSIAVRKAKAEEKKRNKKPRGRPKKENMKIEINEEETYDPETHRIEEKEIFKPKEPQVASANEPPEQPPDDKPPSNSMFDMEKLFARMDKTIEERLSKYDLRNNQNDIHNDMVKEKEPPAYFKYMKEMKDHEEMIREDERKKLGLKASQKKQEILQQQTNKYYKRMPLPQSSFHQPSNNNGADLWDNLLNPKKRY
jgi:hypothetical protein